MSGKVSDDVLKKLLVGAAEVPFYNRSKFSFSELLKDAANMRPRGQGAEIDDTAVGTGVVTHKGVAGVAAGDGHAVAGYLPAVNPHVDRRAGGPPGGTEQRDIDFQRFTGSRSIVINAYLSPNRS